MTDRWESGDPYEYFMGRWSRPVAKRFVDWLALPSNLSWLDIGCGTGSLSEAIVTTCEPKTVTALDQSPGFVSAAQARLGDAVRCVVGNATALPLKDSTVDVAVSGLVLNFIPDPAAALQEMIRVVKPGGTVAVFVWDYTDVMEFLTVFWDTAVALDGEAASLHEGTRFPHTTQQALAELFAKSICEETSIAPLEIVTRFRDFDDYWQPFLGGQGPAPSYVKSLSDPARNRLRETLRSTLPVQKDGAIELKARAWAARGIVGR